MSDSSVKSIVFHLSTLMLFFVLCGFLRIRKKLNVYFSAVLKETILLASLCQLALFWILESSRIAMNNCHGLWISVTQLWIWHSCGHQLFYHLSTGCFRCHAAINDIQAHAFNENDPRYVLEPVGLDSGNVK